MEINKQILQTALERKRNLDLVELITNEMNGLFKDLQRFSKDLYVGVTLTDGEMFESFPEIHHWRMKYTGWGRVKMHIPVKTTKSFLGFKYESKVWVYGWADDLLSNWNFSYVKYQKVGGGDYITNEQLDVVYNEIKTVRFNITKGYADYIKQNKKAPS